MDELNAFRKALQFTLKWEGGYVNDPKDPGGETKWGISKRSYPSLDIKNLSEEDALEIYRRDYWIRAGCSQASFPYSVVIFDTAVNCGVSRTMAFIRDGGTTSFSLLLERQDYYYRLVEKNPALKKYLKGWLNRVADLKKFVELNEAEED